MKIILIVVISFLLTGCENAQLKKGGLYVNNDKTCLGMDDLGVAKVNSKF